MSEEKPENQYDWEKLKADLKEITPRLGTMTAIMADRDPPRVLSGVSAGIYPVSDSEKPENFDLKLYEKLKDFCRDKKIVIVMPKHDSPKTNTGIDNIIHIGHVVDIHQTSVLRMLKQRKQTGLDLEYCMKPFSIPITPHNDRQEMTPQDLSAKLGFDTEAMIKPKTNADVSAVLDEAISEMDIMSKMLDEENKNFCRERFLAGGHSFTQYMDKKDDAHIEWIDPEIKKNILDNNLVGVSPWVEIFKIDGSYCNFTNKHGKVVGRLKMKYPTTSPRDTWVFQSEPIGGTTWEFVCTKPYPYDCEREVVQWMVKQNLFDAFVNHQ